MTSFERKPTVELDAEKNHKFSKSARTSQNTMKAVPSIEEPQHEYMKPVQSSLYRARSNPEDSTKYPRRNSANVASLALPVTPVIVQSPKLRNRFTLNLPMSRKKKQNRRSLPPIEDSPESESGSNSTPNGSPAEEKRKVSNDTRTPRYPISPTSSGTDSVFNSPTSESIAVANKVNRAQSESVSSSLTDSNLHGVMRNSDTYLYKEERKKTLLQGTTSNPSSKSPKLFDDINPLPTTYWSPSVLRRGSSPAITTKNYTGFTRQRSGVIKVKVCFV